MYERCRAFLAVGPRLPRRSRRWMALRRWSGRWRWVSRWEELEAQRAAGIVALLAHEPEAARRQPAHGLGAHASASKSTSRASSRSRPISSKRSSSSPSSKRPRRSTSPASAGGAARASMGLATASAALRSIALAAPPYDEQPASELEAAADDYARFGLRLRPREVAALARPGAAPDAEVGRGAPARSSSLRRCSTSSARRAGPTRRAPSSRASGHAGRSPRAS